MLRTAKLLVAGVAILSCLPGFTFGSERIPVHDAISILRADVPAVRMQTDAGRITRVYGTRLVEATTPDESAELFLTSYAEVFGVSPDDLELVGFADSSELVQPVMVDPATGEYKFYLYRYAQRFDGLPVYGADLRILVRNVPGSPTVLAASALRDLGTFQVSSLAAAPVVQTDLAIAAAAAQMEHDFAGDPRELALPELVNFTEPELVIWAGVDDMNVDPQLAVTYVGDNGTPDSSDFAKFRFVADAVTGEILHVENRIVFEDVVGNVSGIATPGPRAPHCVDPELMPLNHALVSVSGGNSAYTDANGDYTISNSGTSAVTVTSTIRGQYFRVYNDAGSDESLSQIVTPPGPADFIQNEGDPDEFTRAQVDGYIRANEVRDFTLTYNPSYPTIASQTNFPVYVNRTDGYCPGNAWYSGSSINFCQSDTGLANTAYSAIIHHEYGHHLVDRGGSGQGEYGEGMSDCMAMLILDHSKMGMGFHAVQCARGIRDADNDLQYPCEGEIHECGQLLSGAVWSTRNELVVTEPSNYIDVLGALTVNSILLHSGTAITPSITTDFLTLDDDDGDLSNGSPHYDEITTGFLAHNLWTAPPANDDCADAERACPGTYANSTASVTNDGTASCGSSSSAPDVWYKYTPASSGTLTLSLCDSGYDTVISVHSGCPGTGATEAGCNDDDGWNGECSFWPVDQSYLQVSVTANTTYLIRVAGASGASGDYVLALSGPDCAAEEDTTPPAPTPLTWAAVPTATGTDAISMTATTASDDTPPVEYEFELTAGGTGGTSSNWQTATAYVDDGLAPNTAYTYRTRARDGVATPNVTDWSDEATATTWAAVPGTLVLSSVGVDSLDVEVAANGNPSGTEFAIQCTATTDGSWSGMWVDASGQPSATAVWQTEAQWAGTTIGTLLDCTDYTFAAQARNTDLVETAFSSGATAMTMLGADLNGDDTVNLEDLQTLLSNYGGSGVGYAGGDLNGDNNVDLEDLQALLAAYGATCP